jgi:hypothetical protein
VLSHSLCGWVVYLVVEERVIKTVQDSPLDDSLEIYKVDHHPIGTDLPTNANFEPVGVSVQLSATSRVKRKLVGRIEGHD